MRLKAGVTVKATASDAVIAEDVTQRQRPEKRACEAWKEEHRHKHQNDDHAGIDDRTANFERGLQHNGEARLASAFCRKRRRMFSTSMIASSTTSPSAMMSPARIIVLIVSPRQREQQQRHGE
jgi:hypothetical protein